MRQVINTVCCGLLAVVFAPFVSFFASFGAVLAGYTKLNMFYAFVVGCVCAHDDNPRQNILHLENQTDEDITVFDSNDSRHKANAERLKENVERSQMLNKPNPFPPPAAPLYRARGY